jgi:deoxyribonuclease-4
MKSTRTQTVMRLGVHVSIAGKLSQAVERAEALGCNTMQIFSRSPRGWDAKPFDPAELEKFRVLRKKADITPLSVHGSYLINLASAVPSLYNKSVKAFIEELERCDQLGAEYLVAHVGSCAGSTEEDGMDIVTRALNTVLKGTRFKTMILLENTARERGDIGYRMEQIGQLLTRIDRHPQVGICLDTCHLFAAGYDISKPDGVNQVADETEKHIGLDRLRFIHANDSKKGLDCRVDRHQHIGQGGIGIEGFRAFVNHPAFRDVPMVLETPKDTPQDDPRNLKTMRELALK